MYWLYAGSDQDTDPQLLFEALADPTRRALFERLVRTPRTVGALAQEAGISQPAASQHLRTLREAGLAVGSRQGRHRWYRADPRGLDRLRQHLERYWGDILAAYTEPSPDPGRPG